ncbi:MAG: hypothetical protein OXT06_10385 [Rhodospirillaceae bacterium]|nr:hypothetical protein [Rhodospirillaceae bacterium]
MSLKFRTKLTIFIGAILVAVQLVNTISVYTSTRRNAIEQGRQQLTFARNILLRQLDDLTSQFVEGARVVTLDSVSAKRSPSATPPHSDRLYAT